MAYRVVSEDGLRIRGTRVATKDSVISEEFYRDHADDYGWKDSVERVAKADTNKRVRKPKEDGTEPEVSDVGQTVVPTVSPSEAGTADVSGE